MGFFSLGPTLFSGNHNHSIDWARKVKIFKVWTDLQSKDDH